MPYRDTVSTIEMVPLPPRGRTFKTTRRIRLGDATPGGRVRLDAVARYLQDIANDDARDAGTTGADLHGWVVRRTVIDVHEFPRYLDPVTVTTWVGGIGSHWAERRTRIRTEDERVCIDAASIWVHIDMTSMKPRQLSEVSHLLWADAANGRVVNARLSLKQSMIADVTPTRIDDWPTRYSDFDALGHMNNAAYWEIVEENLARRPELRAGIRFIVEHIEGIEPGHEVNVAVFDDDTSSTLRVSTESTVNAMCWLGPKPE